MNGQRQPNLWEPLRVGQVSERIAERILGLIAAEQLRPGDRLPPERELAQLLGVSRPSLREALKSLQARGHVHVRHGTGVFVAEPRSARELHAALREADMSVAELYAMREVLEGPAAEWAAERGDRARLNDAREVYDELLAASLEPEVDWERLETLDAAFHLRIVDAAGNRFLRQTAGVLHEILLRGMEATLAIPGRLEASRREHEQILHALLAGDGPRAREAAIAHIHRARDAALAGLEGNTGK